MAPPWTIQVGTVSEVGVTVTFTPLLTVNGAATPGSPRAPTG